MKAITISSSSSRNIQSNHGRRLKTNSRKAKLSLLLIQRIIFVGILCFVLLYLLLVNMAMSSSSSTEKKTTLSSGSLEKNGEPRIKRQVDTKRINAVGTPEMANTELKIRPNTILTAYLEPPIDLELWQNVKPLSIRNVTAKVLTKMQFPGLNSCSKLPEQWPVNDYPQEDPFLPWIHDMFPTHDGKFIQFVAQNKQRCFTGKDDEALLQQMAPQASLFQHVPIMRISNTSTNININTKPIQYKLTSHSNADLDGMATRFLCRFSNGEETLSVFNFSYEWASRRRRLKEMFSKHGRDNQKPHLSQLLFQCPVPPSLIEAVQSGSSVLNDYATLFLDLIPIRTPARYGPPDELLPPYYKDFESKNMPFDAVVEWGDQHILPAIDDSGRWENIPICKPSHLTYEQDNKDQNDHPMAFLKNTTSAVKQHRVVACIWASAGYSTRGNKFTIQDGKRRLLEWIVHHKNIGVEHVYVYDNSGAFASKNSSLDSVAKLFTDHVTLIPWPARTCNNHMDSVGERSSQYAAEASCRLRFGPQADWIAQFDIDEYIIPMGEANSINYLLDKLDQEGNKIVSFESSRAWPRRDFIEDPNTTRLFGLEHCGFKKQYCFQLRIPHNVTLLQAYNCDKTKTGEKRVEPDPAEKQIYRPDYVHHHFIHYSLVTETTKLNKEDTLQQGLKWTYKPEDQLSRLSNESSEALMLHAKAIAPHETNLWEKACRGSFKGRYACRLGNPFPEHVLNVTYDTLSDEHGIKYNCYISYKIENHWVKLLSKELEERLKLSVNPEN